MATPRDLEAAFIEQITAGATHELRNVLAIVKEAAGLIEDLLNAGAEPGTLDRDKVFWAIARIEAQVGRGTALVGALNRFAHSLGGPDVSFDLRRAVEQAALLGRRFVQKRELEIQVRQDEGELNAVADGLRTYMALIAGIECCAEQVAAGGSVVIGAELREGEPAVRFSGEDGDAAPVPVRADAALMNLRLGGFGAAQSPLIADDGASGFLFLFPLERVQ